MDILYAILLPIHSVLRWLILIAALFAIIRALTGMQFKRPYETLDDRAGMIYTILLDTQLLIGLILYIFVSPWTRPLLTGDPTAMSNAITRYFGVEHIFIMAVAVVLAHIGRARAKSTALKMSRRPPEQKPTPAERLAVHRWTLIFYLLSLAALLAGIPWPFLPGVGRPWIRIF